MKIYKISQQNPENEQAQTAQQEIAQAQTQLQTAIANLNQSLQILETTQVMYLFDRTELINSIQSGLTDSLDPNTVNNALSAMSNITRTIPAINNAQRVLEDYGLDISTIKQTMIQAIQSNNWQDFQAQLGEFQQEVGGMGNTQSY